MKQTVTKRKLGLLVAGALALIGQVAVSAEAVATKAPETMDVVTVTAKRPEQPEVKTIEADASATIEAINRRIESDLEKSLERIGAPRIELAISEVPTRG